MKEKGKNNNQITQKQNSEKQLLSPDEFLAMKMESHYQGPLPHPEILKGFNDAVDNGAERVFR